MSSNLTDDEVKGLLGECNEDLSTIHRTITTSPGDFAVRFGLPSLKTPLWQLANFMAKSISKAKVQTFSMELFDQLYRIIEVSIIHPRARKVRFQVPESGRLKPLSRPNLNGISRIFALFVAQGLAFQVLDRIQTTPSWKGNFWVPQMASLVMTYALVLHHQPSWIPSFCYLAAQGVCVLISSGLGLVEMLGLLFVLATVVAEAPPTDRRMVEVL